VETSNTKMAITTVMESKMKIIKGETLEEQMKRVDVILSRFSRHLRKTASGIVTPFPISGYTKTLSSEPILRYMFPAPGKVLSGVMHIEEMPKNGVDLYAVLHRDEVSNTRSLYTRKKLTIVHPKIEVITGDRLSLSIVTKGGDQAVGIWISLLWEPKVPDAVVKKFLIEELDRQQEEEIEVLSKEEV